MTKRILAVLLALTMVLSLCSFEAFAEDSAEKDLVVVWELAAPVEEIGSKTAKDLFGDQFEDFIKAINTEGAVLEFTVTNSSSDGMMTNIFTNVDDWSNAYVCDSGYPTGTKTFTVAAADLMEHGGITEITNLRFQFGVYKKDEIKIALNSAEVMVPMSAEEPKEPEGTKLEMARNGDWNWKADVAWEAVEASLKDITPEALAKIESIEVSLTVTGAIVDGETIDASKVGANLVIQGKWQGWHSVDATAKDGVLTATIKPGDFALEEDDVNAYQVISQLTIGPDDLPNGLEGTKEGAVYYKDAKVTITEKPEEKKPEGYTVEVVKSEKTVDGNVLTADVSSKEVKTDALLLTFEKGAPADGEVKVYYEGDEVPGVKEPVIVPEVKPTIPEGYEVYKTVTGTSIADSNGFTILMSDYNFTKDDWIFFTISYDDTLLTKAPGFKVAIQIQGFVPGDPDNNIPDEWPSEWDGIGSDEGVNSVSGTIGELLAKNPSVTMDNLYQVFAQVWNADDYLDCVKSYSLVVAKKTATTPAEPAAPGTDVTATLTGSDGESSVPSTFGEADYSNGSLIVALAKTDSFAANDSAVVTLKGSATLADGAVFALRCYPIGGTADVGQGAVANAENNVIFTMNKTGDFEAVFQVNYTGAADHLLFKRTSWIGGNTGEVSDFKISSISVFKGTMDEYNAAKTTATASIAAADLNEAAPASAEFKKGQKYVEITGLDSSKKIKAVQITFEEGAEITADVLTKIEAKAVSTDNRPSFPNQFYPGDGFVVRLDDQFHAFSFNGVLIPLYHEFNAAGFCTICGYYKAPAAADEVVVTTPTEPGDQDSQEEVDEPGDDITVDDTEETKEENPKTGLSLAVLPMILTAAAVVTGRKH